ncbi:MAG: hypothetical protein FJ095_03070 [Deltaproteobacteria bacterium]|nr:hypothetical protein [Deltaproteobacteria bacterium]
MSAPPSDAAPSATIIRPPEGLARGRYTTSAPVVVGAAAALLALALGLTLRRLRRGKRSEP